MSARRGRRSSCALRCHRPEELEGRRLLSTQQWLNANGGSFGDAANWTGGVVPGAGDTAAFTLAGSGTVRLGADAAVGSVSVADPSYRVVSKVSLVPDGGNLSVGGALNVGVNGSGELSLTGVGGLGGFSAGSASVAQLGNGTLTVQGTSLAVAGSVRLGLAATATNPNLSIAQVDLHGAQVTAGNVDLAIAGVALDGGSRLATTGALTLSNSSLLTIKDADVNAGSVVIGNTSNGSAAKLDLQGYNPPLPFCPGPGFLKTGPLTVSAVGSTDPGSIKVNHSTVTTTGAAVLAASRTTGTVHADFVGFAGAPPCGPVPAVWNIAGPLTVGRNGGVADLELSTNAYLTATDVQVGLGVDPATGAPAGGTIRAMNDARITLSGSLGMAVNVGGQSGGAYVQIGPGGATLNVGRAITVGGNSTLDLENGIVHAGSINNGSGSIRGYGVIQLDSVAASSNYAIAAPTGIVSGVVIDVGKTDTSIYSSSTPDATLTIDGGTLRSANGLLLNNFRGQRVGGGTILTTVTVSEVHNGIPSSRDIQPIGVLKLAGLVFRGRNTFFTTILDGTAPGPQGSGYSQLDVTTADPIDLGDPAAAPGSHVDNAVLDISFSTTSTHTPGQQYTIIRNESNAPYRGYFQQYVENASPPYYVPLPEGTHFVVGGQTLTITYQGGPNGHDTVIIANRAPTANAGAGAGYTVAEGGFARLSAAASSDPEQPAAQLLYQWDLNGDGLYGDRSPTATNGTEVGQQVTFLAAGLDGPAPYTVRLRVTDADGLFSESSAVVNVTNSPPTAQFNADSSVGEGSSSTVIFRNPADPSAADTASGFTYSYDYTNDGTFDVLNTRSTSVEVPASTFPDGPSTVVVRARITDKDGGFTDYTRSILVLNTPPTATFNAPASLGEALPLSISLSGVGDPSAADVAAGFTYAFDLGAGLSAFGFSPSATDPAARSGRRTVRGVVRDKDGGTSTYSQVVEVVNTPPAVSTPGGDPTIGRGQTFTRAGSFADPGSDGYNGVVDYGDGAGPSPLILQNNRTFVVSHAYPKTGVYNVTVAINDGGGLGGSSTFKVNVVPPRFAPADLDGDGKSDLVVYRPATGRFLAQRSTAGPLTTAVGAPNLDQPVVADYDGDGRADLAVYRPSTGQWIIQPSAGGTRVVAFGAPNLDIPVPADYDGDGKADLAVYRPTTAQWLILRSTAGPEAVPFGAPGLDRPVPADYDGDGVADLAVFRPTTAQWLILQSTDGPRAVAFGAPGLDRPIPGDFDGDGKADLAVFRPTAAQWLILQSTAGPRAVAFGGPGIDVPLAVDLDGDGKADLAVYRSASSQWLGLRSAGGATVVTLGGGGGDVPVPTSASYRYTGGLTIAAVAPTRARPPQGPATGLARHRRSR